MSMYPSSTVFAQRPIRAVSALSLFLGLSAGACTNKDSSKSTPSPAAQAQETPKAQLAAPVQHQEQAQHRLEPSSASAKPMLSLQRQDLHSRASLNYRGQAPLELALSLPKGASWNRALVGRAVLRQPDGSQIALGSDKTFQKLRSNPEVAPLPLPELMPGTSMIIVSAGTAQRGPGRDDMAGNRHFMKIIVSKADAQGRIPKQQSGVMQKTGQPLEIRPVSLPMALKLGDEMSVKVYEDQSHRGNAELEVHHPDGEVEVIHTAANGMAYFEVRAQGVHHLQFNTEIEDEPASAQLTFSVPSQQGEVR